MKDFNFGKYAFRVFKYLMFYVILVVALVAIAYYTSDHRADLSFWDVIIQGNPKALAALIVIFALSYPFIGFSHKNVYFNRAFDTDKEAIINLITDSGYILVSDADNKLTFRQPRIVTRIFRVFEDQIVIDYSDNPLAVDGLRRDVVRLTSHLEYYFRRTE